MFCIPARFLYQGVLIPKTSRNLLKIFKERPHWNIFSRNEEVLARLHFF